MTEESEKGLKELGLFSSIVGHLGDGNFHEAIMHLPEEKAAVDKHVKSMIARALEMEGTCTVSRTSNTPLCVLTKPGRTFDWVLQER